MDSAGILDCDSGKCKMKHHPNEIEIPFMEEDLKDYELDQKDYGKDDWVDSLPS